MKNKHRVAIVVISITALFLALAWKEAEAAATTTIATSTAATSTMVVVPQLSHRQQLWIDALEWCESRGVVSAINEMDRDGTPSYGSFQFKPSTFTAFAEKYHVTGVLMDESAQREIVAAMVLDPRMTVRDWHQQFPDCTKRHIGVPPRNQ